MATLNQIKQAWSKSKQELKCLKNKCKILSSRCGLEVERPLRIQLKAGQYCLGGSNPAWEHLYGRNSDYKGLYPDLEILISPMYV